MRLKQITVTRGSKLKYPRKCGKCSGCCHVMSIVELSKPARTDCPHTAGGCGCDIYADRPQSCRDWACAWVMGEAGTEDDRPDKIGGFLWRTTCEFGEVFVLDALAEGSLTDRAYAMAEAESRARGKLVYVRNGPARRQWFGPAHLMRMVEEFQVSEQDFPDEIKNP